MSTLTPQKTATPKKEYWKAKKNDIILAVIGRTGAGKTSFIGHARNDPTLKTSKHDVPRGYRLHGHPRFGERIVLVDTPGFDGDQPVADEKVVKRIQEWYKNNYKASLLAGGILYIHNINDTRTDAASPADWVHLSRLFGPSGAVVGRLVVVMSHWHDADGNEALLHQFEERKEELSEKWKGLIGAEPKRIEFYDTPESVQEAIELLLSDAAVTASAAARSTSPSPEAKSQPRTPQPSVTPPPIPVLPAAEEPQAVVEPTQPVAELPQPIVEPVIEPPQPIVEQVVEPPQPIVEPTPTPPVIAEEPIVVKPVEVAPEPIPEPPAAAEEKVEEPAPAPIVAEEPTPAPEPEVKDEEPVAEVQVESPPAPPAPAPVAEVAVVEEIVPELEPTPAPAPTIADPVPEPPIVEEEELTVAPVSVRLVTQPLPHVEEPPVIPFAITEPIVDAVLAPVVPESTPATETAESDALKDELEVSSAAAAVNADDAEKTGVDGSAPVLEAAVETTANKEGAESKPAQADDVTVPSTTKAEQSDEKKVDSEKDGEKDKVDNEKRGVYDDRVDEKTSSTTSKGGVSEIPYGQEKIKISWWRKLCCF